MKNVIRFQIKTKKGQNYVFRSRKISLSHFKLEPRLVENALTSYRYLLTISFAFHWNFRSLVGFKNLLRSIESIGISAVYGINYFGRGILGTESYINYIKYDSLGKDLLNSSLHYVPSLREDYRNFTRSLKDYGTIKNR